MERHDRVAGALLGVAIGDAAGLPFEGMSMERVGRRFERVDRYRLLGLTGFVSDDTEQSALVAQALALGGEDAAAALRHFRRSMVGWFARLPFGIGGATLRACVRMMLGVAAPGVRSAGNGAAMRAGIVGVHFAHDVIQRRAWGRTLASLTHTDERAIEAALYVAEVSARASLAASSATVPATLAIEACEVLADPQLRRAAEHALELAGADAPLDTVVSTLGNTGFVVHTVGLCTYCFARFGSQPMQALEAAIRAGGDTDTHAAIVGGWVGSLHGASALPPQLISELHDGPFGPSHLLGLASALVNGTPPPRWSWPCALMRNLALYPVVLAHAMARLVPS